MRIITDKQLKLRQPHAMTIGKFDGMHAGHMALMRKTVAYAKSLGIPSLVFTFQPNPISVLSSEPFEPLISEDTKRRVLSGLGIDILVNFPFDRAFANSSPEAFMKMIWEDLECRALVVGESFRFGRDRTGGASLLAKYGQAYGALVDIVKSVEIDGAPVSSSRIRKALAAGNRALAERLLGRPVEEEI